MSTTLALPSFFRQRPHALAFLQASRAPLLGGLLIGLASTGALAAESFKGSYAQNFDSLPATGTAIPWANDSTLAGWSLFNKDKAAIATYLAGTGSATNGSFYSFGAAGATERALGVVISSGAYFGAPANNAVAGFMALALRNDTAASIDALNPYGGSTP